MAEPRIWICFHWHMHQPFYKDLVSGEYKLPWTRMHALKDYYGMVKILGEFPDIHQTFNLVPSLVVQMEEYASGEARDPFFRLASKPAEELTEREQEAVLQYFFQANAARMIYRYPRYGDLYDAWLAAGRAFGRARRAFDARALRDLQVLSQLAWFDEEYHARDGLIRALARKGRDYTVEDQRQLSRKQTEVVGNVMPAYRRAAGRGQIEISTTPFYHPILPLICDSSIAEIAHPYVPLPTRFRHPEDAREHLVRARSFMKERVGFEPAGLWPSEGSVSDEALHIAADCGFQWFSADNGVLGRTLNANPDPRVTYRPYLWKQGGHRMFGLFRDRYLSDLIGFVYHRMGAVEAATHFMERVHENCAPILASGEDALVPVFLDGENAWEYYEESGRPFLRELYRRVSEDKRMKAVTISEALQHLKAREIGHVFPGSWINANFDIWIGAEEDNRAWEYLLKARQTYERALNSPVPEDKRLLAHEELLIAEGSDWCWWYGPEHDSANRPEFDQLFRSHLANVYTLLGLTPPDELSRPILQVRVQEFHQTPTGPVQPTIDGRVTSYFEWLGAGVYKLDQRTGAMHGQRFFVHELRYGSDGYSMYLRLDFVETAEVSAEGTEIRITVQSDHGLDAAAVRSVLLTGAGDGVESAYDRVCEVKVSLGALGIQHGRDVRFQLSLWQAGLPVEALPPQGWIELSTAEPSDMVF